MTSKAAFDLKDGNWISYRYDAGHDAVHFRHVPRDAREKATFLTDEYLGPAAGLEIHYRREAVAASPSPAPLRYIFHSAFCCSTLLARALDIPGAATALKEPLILNDLVGVRHRGEAQGQELADRLKDALGLLARPFEVGEAVIIKPSNVANALAPAMMALSPDSRAVLLHAPLETFLKSIAKKGLDGRTWVRDLLVKQITDQIIDLGFSAQDYLRLTDLQSAAITWLAQHALFADLAKQLGPDRVRTLDSETLLARPTACLEAINPLFSLKLNEAQIDHIANGPAFGSHSKTGAAFGADEREREYADAASAHADEIAKVAHWAKVVADGAGIAMRLPNALLG